MGLILQQKPTLEIHQKNVKGFVRGKRKCEEWTARTVKMRRSYIVKGGAGHDDDDIAESPSHLELPHLGARQKKTKTQRVQDRRTRLPKKRISGSSGKNVGT